jgi:glutamyl-tRNA synthetase
VHDLLHGEYTGIVDDFVVRRGDGVAAYNLAVVVDDAAQAVDQVVRGDDLLSSSPRQAYLARLLGYPEPTYAHVALVLNEDGARLAKRDGAVTLAEIGVERAVAQIAESLGSRASNLDELLTQFDPARLPRHPWIYQPAQQQDSHAHDGIRGSN